jgi:hypothetical protein
MKMMYGRRRECVWALLAALLALASVVEAWGPLSHYYFARQAFPNAHPDRYIPYPPPIYLTLHLMNTLTVIFCGRGAA